MHTRLRRRPLQRGFTLIEILTVLAIIGILTAILIPAVSKAQERTRLTATLAEIRSLKVIVSEAATRLGGTLPYTEGYNLLPRLSGTIKFSPDSFGGPVLTPIQTGETLMTASRLITLDQVLMSLKPPLMDTPFTTRFGGGAAPTPLVQPRLFFNPANQRFQSAQTTNIVYNLDGVNASDDSSRRSRIECARVVSRASFDIAVPARADVNVARGINFDLDGNGVAGVDSSSCAFVVYKRVSTGDAYALALQLNGTLLMDDQAPGGVAAQSRGKVIYGASNGGVVDVYVFLAQF